MKAITFFNGEFTGTRKIAQRVAAELDRKLIQDSDLIEITASQCNIIPRKIEESIYVKPPFRENFSGKKASIVTALKNTLADLLKTEEAVYCGFISQLIPDSLSFRVLVTAGASQRLEKVFREEGLSGNDAVKRIRESDSHFFKWTRYLQEENHWEAAAYDTAIPSDSMDLDQSLNLFRQALDEKSKNQPVREGAIDDFVLAARMESAMSQKGFHVGVSVSDQRAELTVRQQVVMLVRYEKKLKKIADTIPNVKDVKIRVGRRFFRPDIWRKHEFRMYPKHIYKRIEKEYAQIYQDIFDTVAPSVERRTDNQPRLWT